MKTIFSRVRFNAKQVTVMVVFALLASLAQLAAPSLVSMMIDGVSDNNQNMIIYLAVAMIILSVVACITNIVSTNLAAKLTARFSADLRKEVFHKVQSFSASEMDKFGTASLITRTTTDVTVIQSFLIMLFRIGLLAPMMAVIGLILSVATTGKLALVLAIAVPLLIVLVAAILIRASIHSAKLRKKIDNINKLFLETLEGVRVIRAFNKQDNEIGRFDEANKDATDVSRKSIAMSGMMMPVVYFLFGITSVGAMLVGSVMVARNTFDVSALVAATTRTIP